MFLFFLTRILLSLSLWDTDISMIFYDLFYFFLRKKQNAIIISNHSYLRLRKELSIAKQYKVISYQIKFNTRYPLCKKKIGVFL